MNSPCSIELLESALTGNLPAEEETSLHRHLEACEACSAALEQMAGGSAWCQEAAAQLTRDELDAEAAISDELSEVDFTVEHPLGHHRRHASVHVARASQGRSGRRSLGFV